MRRIVFLLYPGFELLDFSGPLQVFHEARSLGLELEFVFAGPAPALRCAQGLALAELVA